MSGTEQIHILSRTFDSLSKNTLDASSHPRLDHGFELGGPLIEPTRYSIEICSRYACKVVDKDRAVCRSSRYRIYLPPGCVVEAAYLRVHSCRGVLVLGVRMLAFGGVRWCFRFYSAKMLLKIYPYSLLSLLHRDQRSVIEYTAMQDDWICSLLGNDWKGQSDGDWI